MEILPNPVAEWSASALIARLKARKGVEVRVATRIGQDMDYVKVVKSDYVHLLKEHERSAVQNGYRIPRFHVQTIGDTFYIDAA